MGSVYKYYPPKEHNLDSIEKSYFFLCMAKHLNDPYELSFALYSKLAINQNIHFDDNIELLKDYGICSFTTDIRNKLMWAMYADNYKGFAVEFDEEKLLKLRPHDNKNPFPRLFFEDVEYIDSLDDLNDPDYRYSLNYYGENKTNLKVEETEDAHTGEYLFIHLCRLKEKKSWAQEKEKRLIACNDLNVCKKNCKQNGVLYENNGYKIPFPKDIVKDIIVGTNTSNDDLNKLIDIARTYNLNTISKIEPTNNPFELTLKTIDI